MTTISMLINFVTGKLKPYQGMKILIHKFYDSMKIILNFLLQRSRHFL